MMSHFHVTLCGSGIRFPFEEEVADGFVTTLRVWASDAATAQQLALERVMADWGPGGAYAPGNAGGSPSLAVSATEALGRWRARLTEPPCGYAFSRQARLQAESDPCAAPVPHPGRPVRPA